MLYMESTSPLFNLGVLTPERLVEIHNVLITDPFNEMMLKKKNDDINDESKLSMTLVRPATHDEVLLLDEHYMDIISKYDVCPYVIAINNSLLIIQIPPSGEMLLSTKTWLTPDNVSTCKVCNLKGYGEYCTPSHASM
jgi:hypothetical protein